MGQEIKSTSFTKEDEIIFKKKLREETKILKRWFDNDLFSKTPLMCGLELEAWLTTNDCIPTPKGPEFLKKLNNDLVVPEISMFNFELNSKPFYIEKSVFSDLEAETLKIWESCIKTAENLSMKPFIIGTLPTLRDYMLTTEYFSQQKRYFALNEQVMKMRDNKPIILDLDKKDWVHIEHDNVITECAATSLQIHFGVTQENAGRYYNASIVSSAFIAALCANSPYLYGQELWDESRIPIFEQSANLKSFRKLNGEMATRVSLGNGYVKNSIFELFLENLDGYPILLPDHFDSDPEWLDHLRLHNGTIWRWNRPLIGIAADGKPSLRLEFRVPSAGPTIVDSMANMCFQIALVEALHNIEKLEDKIPFNIAKENFYNACKFGLDAKVTWLNGESRNIQELIHSELVPLSREAIRKFNISDLDIEKYLDKIIYEELNQDKMDAVGKRPIYQPMGHVFKDYLKSIINTKKKIFPYIFGKYETRNYKKHS